MSGTEIMSIKRSISLQTLTFKTDSGNETVRFDLFEKKFIISTILDMAAYLFYMVYGILVYMSNNRY